jgi:hypothetical protein
MSRRFRAASPTRRQVIPLQRSPPWDGNEGRSHRNVEERAENWDIFCLNGGAQGNRTYVRAVALGDGALTT